MSAGRSSTGTAKRGATIKSPAKIALATALLALVIGSVHFVRNWTLRRDIVMSDPDAILTNPALAAFAVEKGRRVFQSHCSSCHGPAAKGNASLGMPDLTDQDFLYGTGQVSEIEDIVRYGIRSGNRRGRQLSAMPAYASARPYASEPIPPLTPAEVRDVVQGLVARAGKPADQAAAARGTALYLGRGGCYDCHGGDGKGDAAIGAPNLLDDIWLYGDGSPASIAQSIEFGRKGYSPAYAGQLGAADMRAVAAYTASLSTLPAGRALIQ